MNMMKQVKYLFPLLAALLLVACGGHSDKKTIRLTYPNWAEGIAVTHLAKGILEDQGYKVELLNADIAPIFASLSNKRTDAFLDAWMPITHKDYMDKYGDRLETLGTMFDNARVGLVVPDYVTINSIDELKTQADRFNKQIVGIDAGAGIMAATEKAIEAYGLDMELLTGSGAAMTATLQKAIDNKQWVVVTGWTPHWMFGRYQLKFLADPKGVYGNAEHINTLAWKGFSKKDPFAAELLRNIHLNDEQISSLMTAVEATKNDEMGAVRQWMEQHKELIQSWIPKR